MAETPRLILAHDFEGGVSPVPYEVLSGNGTVSEAGGLLSVALAAGQGGDWRNGKLVRFPFTLRADDVEVWVEAILASITANANTQVWAGLRQDDNNVAFLHVPGGTTNAYAYKIIGSTWTSVAGPTTISFPVRLGFLWDPRTRILTWRVRTNGTWTVLATQTLSSFNPDALFLYARNYTGTNAVTATFSEVSGYAREAEGAAGVGAGIEDALEVATDKQYHLPGSLPADPHQAAAATRPGPDPRAATRDAYRTMDVGGAHRPQEFGMGLALPGPADGDIPSAVPATPGAATRDEAPEPVLQLSTRMWFSSENQDAVQGVTGVRDGDRRWQGADPQFNAQLPTLDGEGHQHLTTYWVYRSFIYDASADAWNFPTAGGFTGYARNGKKYTNGVEDAGPVWAPWASEAASQDRSARDDFPLLSLIIVDRLEVVVYDLDLYHSGGTLTVWMRFKLGNDASNFYALGRGAESIQDVCMANGVLYAGSKTNSWENGGLFAVDFKATGQNVGQLVRADGHWWAASGKTIVNRNTASWWTNTGVSPSLRINNEDVHALTVRTDPGTPGRAWAAQVGEDGLEIIEFLNNAGKFQYWQNPSALVYNVGEIRKVAFGKSGEMWWSQQNRLIRAGLDYQKGVIVDPLTTGHGDLRGRISAAVELPEAITSLAVGANHVFCAGASGIWRVHRVSLLFHLCYTVAGGGGGGVFESPPDGEVLPGETAAPRRIQLLRALKTDYLVGSSWPVGGAFAIRCHDNVVVRAVTHPTLQEAGAMTARGFLVV